MISVTFKHELPTFKNRGLTDFEVLIAQSVYSGKEGIDFHANKYEVGNAPISHGSSICIYEGKLTKKSRPVLEIPCTLERELRILNKIINHEYEH